MSRLQKPTSVPYCRIAVRHEHTGRKPSEFCFSKLNSDNLLVAMTASVKSVRISIDQSTLGLSLSEYQNGAVFALVLSIRQDGLKNLRDLSR
jgi:hypothetical protein